MKTKVMTVLRAVMPAAAAATRTTIMMMMAHRGGAGGAWAGQTASLDSSVVPHWQQQCVGGDSRARPRTARRRGGAHRHLQHHHLQHHHHHLRQHLQRQIQQDPSTHPGLPEALEVLTLQVVEPALTNGGRSR